MVEKEQDHEQLDGAGAEVLRAFCALADDVLPHLSPAEQVLYLRLFRLSHARRSPFAKVTAHVGRTLPNQEWGRNQRQERRCRGVADRCRAGRRQVVQHVAALLP